ncbi:hypothetical protein BDW69DRAFT_169459 [Aspergillus filifer]
MMRPSRSGSRTRQDLTTKLQSPARRRVTRSQSRDIEDTQSTGNDSRGNNDSRKEQSKGT